MKFKNLFTKESDGNVVIPVERAEKRYTDGLSNYVASFYKGIENSKRILSKEELGDMIGIIDVLELTVALSKEREKQLQTKETEMNSRISEIIKTKKEKENKSAK